MTSNHERHGYTVAINVPCCALGLVAIRILVPASSCPGGSAKELIVTGVTMQDFADKECLHRKRLLGMPA